ncbi:small, acid-soluble spore protein, alpha/beta type [Sedimentibacter sp. zth1]|uniref:small, acid-soluble spore protein, alpha/beta type n=1 Tax=Sedimentibacter sp. zth1 TaxID=2816908 RepID=UPI001A91189C|nr:small, acid-soluble spore protein, alpha/beta type [Sedimentibacter sp. zth1]QSX04708.1 small, acid-soluble spore protein, alpha/beta type [Sedimentibacter sp. zth1]
MASRNKLIVPESKQALDMLKMEIASDIGYTPPSDMKDKMYPALVNGLAVKEMVRMGEKMITNNKPSQFKAQINKDFHNLKR